MTSFPPPDDKVQRRLAVILSATAHNYPDLVAGDEEAAVAALNQDKAVIIQSLARHGGRLVDSVGANLMAEFPSALEALRAAVESLSELNRRNEASPPGRRLVFRVGLNLGDIIHEDQRIYGDGVNIAARLDGLAKGGDILISGPVLDQVRHRLELSYEDLGEQKVKNIADPVRVYRVVTAPEECCRIIDQVCRSRRCALFRRLGLGLGLVLLAALAVWFLAAGPRDRSGRPEAPAAGEAQATSLALPERPSVAVLPFLNLSGSPEEDYFADGLTEDLITDLSKVSGLFVISRNSVFAYKNKSARPDQVGRELGVRYILEGSLRRQGDRVRISANLVEAASGLQVWAERYDRATGEIFAVQDEVVQKIVAALKIKLTEGEKSRLGKTETTNTEAYDLALRAQRELGQGGREGLLRARALYQRAVDLDPRFAPAYVGLGWTFLREWTAAGPGDRDRLDLAERLARRALDLNNALPGGHTLLAWIYLWRRQHDLALAEARLAVDLDPNNADSIQSLACVMTFAGQAQPALELITRSRRLNPISPAWYLANAGHALFELGRHDQAVKELTQALAKSPDLEGGLLFLALAAAANGDLGRAREAVVSLKRLNPNFSLALAEERLPYQDRSRLEEALRRLKEAGLG